MTVGWGVSIGARNIVCAAVGGGTDPEITSGRTAVAGGSGANSRILGFGDLTLAAELSFAPAAEAADLVARVLRESMAAAGAVAEHTVLAHPAVYTEQHVSALRRSLARAQLGEVELVAEPIAAAAALDPIEQQAEPNEKSGDATDSMLVYDLGATSLDLTVVVRDRQAHRIAGRPIRSYAFGGRSTAAAIAAMEHDLAPTDEPVAGSPDPVRTAAVRAQLVRDSLPLAHECLRTAGLSPEHLGAILLAGGAAAPVEVAHTLADALGCPVVRGPVTAESVARGAALLGARRSATDTVLVPVRRPMSRTALAGAALAVPLLIPAVLGLLRADDGRPGVVAAVPGRSLPDRPVDGRAGEPAQLPAALATPPRQLPVMWWNPRAAVAVPELLRTQDAPSDPANLPALDPFTRSPAVDAALLVQEASSSAPMTNPQWVSDSDPPGDREQPTPPSPSPSLSIEMPAPALPDSPVSPTVPGLPVDHTPGSMPGSTPSTTETVTSAMESTADTVASSTESSADVVADAGSTVGAASAETTSETTSEATSETTSEATSEATSAGASVSQADSSHSASSAVS
ncbi:FGGY-family carbohydrate kinase [Nocardia sp. NPDC057663]|uniref:FGGY-family carbohydrate kinase n=1 Tax=Nocardia sp. NPDC057663 TaxID=3346201 RepID=UPI00366C68A1